MPIRSRKLGFPLRRPPTHARAGEDVEALLFSTEENAARLREALNDSRENRNMIPFTVEELRREFDRGAE